MPRWRWPLIVGIALAGVIVGAIAVVGTDAVDRYTSTDTFCTSCHTMASLAADPMFQQSAHRGNPHGVQVRCVDCHLGPSTNLVSETWAHATSGIRDVVAEYTGGFADPAVWEKRRIALAHEVRADMRASDSAACRSCHTPGSIHPTTVAGRAAHAMLAERQITCIQCHFNLVHAPVAPLESFIRDVGLGTRRK